MAGGEAGWEMSEHKHDWKIDYSMPTFDTHPVHRGVYCDCGATACREDETGFIHDLDEPAPLARELVTELGDE